MAVSRRRFLTGGTMAAMALVLLKFPIQALAQDRISSRASVNYFDVPIEAQQAAFWYFTRSTFEAYVGGIFTSSDPRGQLVQLRLSEVAGYAPDPQTRVTTASRQETECFALLFEASSELPTLSSIHTIEHPVLGKFDLFLNRSEVGGKIYYQAIINRLA